MTQPTLAATQPNQPAPQARPPQRRTAARHQAFIALALCAAALPGCATSRYDQLRARSNHVGKRLSDEQQTVLAQPPEALRQQRLDHLTTLHYTHSAADIALGSVRHVVPKEQHDLAYDVIDEVYDSIEWNIPLIPGDTLRPLPAAFSGNTLNLSALDARQNPVLVQPITR